jgi:chromosome segregation ATPase
MLEKDKQIQQLKYFLHQGALDFEKLQTRHRAVEAESLEQKHRIIELQTSLERNQDSSRNTIRRLQEQVAAQSRQLADGERAQRAAETRQENLEDEVDRLSAQIFQMEERLVAGAGQLELARYEAGRVPALEQRQRELEDAVRQLEDDKLALREQVDQLVEELALLEENAGALDSRVGEEAATIEQLNIRLEENVARRAAEQEAELQREREAQAAEHERKLVAAMELLDRKEESLRASDERLRSTQAQLQALQAKHDLLEAQLGEVGNAARDARREAEVLTRELEVKAKTQAELERAVKAATESAEELKAELARQAEKFQTGGDRNAQELALRAERIQELENSLATQRIEVQRLSGQVKTAEMKNTEITHWSDKLKSELMQVRTQLDDEIRKRSGSEEQARMMDAQLPEIRRLFDEIEHQVDGFEDNLALEEDRTQRLSESLDQLVESIGVVFHRISEQLAHLEAERGLLADRLQAAEQEHVELAGEAGTQNAEKNRATIHDLNVQLGIMEGNLLTMQVKMQNQLGPSVEKILRVTGDLELLGMINAATELRAIAGTLSGLLQ